MDSLTVNGIPVPTREGETVLQVCQRLGVAVPTLCHYPHLRPTGRCKVCLVEADGKIVTACTHPAACGMRVETESPRAVAARRKRVEVMLRRHRGDCTTCRQTEFCGLLDLAKEVGLPAAFSDDSANRVVQSGALLIDLDKCVECGRCVQVCQEIRMVDALRHPRFSSVPLDTVEFSPHCENCGQCAVACPTGAIVEANRSPADRRVKSTCNYCGTGCSIYLDVSGERVTGITSDPLDPVGHGNLCVKGRFGFGFIHHPDRLTRPLIRRDGRLVEASWEEALDLVAGGLGKIRGRDGPSAVGGIGSARSTNEDNYAFQRLFRAALSTNNIDNCARL